MERSVSSCYKYDYIIQGVPKVLSPTLRLIVQPLLLVETPYFENDIVYRLIRGSRWKNSKIPIFQGIAAFDNPSLQFRQGCYRTVPLNGHGVKFGLRATEQAMDINSSHYSNKHSDT